LSLQAVPEENEMKITNFLQPLSVQNSPQGFSTADWVWVLIFILALILVWWLLTRSTKQSAEEAEELSAQIIDEQEQQVEEVEEVSEEAVEEAPPPSEPDDLTRIEGIGPKINQLLQDAGITTYAQLAQADVDTIDSKLDEAGITFAHPGTWPEQAQLASEGKWDELANFQDELKGGIKE